MRNEIQSFRFKESDGGGEVIERDADRVAVVSIGGIADESNATVADRVDRQLVLLEVPVVALEDLHALLERGLGVDAKGQEGDPHAKNRGCEQGDHRVGRLRLSAPHTPTCLADRR